MIRTLRAVISATAVILCGILRVAAARDDRAREPINRVLASLLNTSRELSPLIPAFVGTRFGQSFIAYIYRRGPRRSRPEP